MEENNILQEYKRNYYDKYIDIEKMNFEDINKLELLSIKGNLGTTMLNSVIDDMVRSKGINEKNSYDIAWQIGNLFHEKYPKGKEDALDIEYKYKDIINNLKEEYEIEKLGNEYGRVDKNYLNSEEIKKVEEYENKVKELEIREKVEIHNIVIDLANKIEKNFDELFNAAIINYKQGKRNNLKGMIITPQNVAALIIYIIIVVAFWESIGAWGFLFAPVIWIVISALSGFTNIEGRRLYGNKWDNKYNRRRIKKCSQDKKTVFNQMIYF